MKKRIKRAFLFLPIIILLIIFLYCMLAFYFRDSFGPNTWINGVYGTGQSVEAINQQLVEKSGVPELIIKGFDHQEYPVLAQDISYTYDFSTPIYSYLKEMNPFMWFWHTIEGDDIQVQPHISFDKEQLQAAWMALDFVAEEKTKETVVRIQKTAAGYELLDGYHNRYDLDAAYDYVCSQLETGVTYIDLSHIENDMDLPVPDDYEEILALWNRVNDFQTTGLIYDMGDERIPLKGSIAAGFLMKDNEQFVQDAEGNLVIDSEKVVAFVRELAGEYDTLNRDYAWTTYDGREITVPAGTYGTELNQETEVNFILEHLRDEGEIIRIPEYNSEAYVRGKNDIGDTYIEIDMTAQKLLVYQAGVQVIETDIVTGNMKRKWDTPDGVYYLYSKQRNRTLRGETYESFVKYWMPVNGNIGLHDANWRKEFGGDIYLTDGSHGCVNIPRDITDDIYEIAEVGMPVIMYY